MPEPPHPVLTAASKLADCLDSVLRMTCSRCRRESALSVQDVAVGGGGNPRIDGAEPVAEACPEG